MKGDRDSGGPKTDTHKLRVLHKAATFGPWHVGDLYDTRGSCVKLVDILTEPDGAEIAEHMFVEDANFCVEAKHAIPAMLDEIEHLREELASVTDQRNVIMKSADFRQLKIVELREALREVLDIRTSDIRKRRVYSRGKQAKVQLDRIAKLRKLI